ncbi:serine hydrolase [Nonomuraea roseoviolacea]|uniref:Beta-lactamase class A catalytic domain-containing protein n=1 Tax=Nonomuraea roseoviolacea subsp. carminata TaxID=160689 RepID=A0ABT1KDB0_9ACTN|nr:serine hydrolase [Nonomuraea roseoviolacea]MCP2352008.1 hypothetical protein [Nonomuraea roseoviolacea subsp. carminata]
MRTILAMLLSPLLVVAPTTATAPADLNDAEAVLAYMRAHPDDVALVTQGISHNADRLTAVASAIKIFHLAAYADAVRQGRAEPDERVSVALWNSYHLPGTDGGAHEAALRRLKPGTSVTLDQLVSAMIEDSDNAAADLLRDRLGPGALLIGTKGGSLPGVISEAMYIVQPGRKPRETVLALRRLPETTWFSGTRSYAHQQFLVRMATDSAFFAKVRTALK